MLHKFTIEMKLEDVENAIELLNLKDYYNLYFDQPFEQLSEEHDYAWIEIQDALIELNIILEEHEIENVDISKGEIASILNLRAEEIQYLKLEMQD